MKKRIGLIGIILILPVLAYGATISDNMTYEGKSTFKNYIDIKEMTAPGNPAANLGRLYVADDTGTTKLYFKDSAGTTTSVLDAASATAWDDFSSPDANKTHAFTTYTSLFTGTSTAADQWTFRGLGNFGDVSVVKIESLTGNPTNGTVLEVVSHDTDADALVVTANSVNAITVQGAGTVAIAGATTASADVTLDDGAGASPNLTFTDVSDETAVLSKADSGNLSVTTLAADGFQVLTGNLRVGNGVPGTAAMDGEDVYIEGQLEVDGAIQLDGVLTVGTANITTLSAGTVKMDAIIPSSAAPTTITLDGAGAGGVTVGGTSTGTITLGGGATLVNLPAATDLTLAGGVISLTDTANSNAVSITNNTMTTATPLIIAANALTSGKAISVTADALDTGTMLYLDSDGIPASTYYIQLYDGAANDLLIGANGATTITGAASTDILTITAGDVQMTAGDIDMDLGFIAIDNTADESNRIARNNATGTAAVLEVEQTHAGGGIALLVDQKNTTAGEYAVDITSSGATQIHFTANGAAGDGMLYDATDAWTGQAFKVDAGPWVGTAGEGAALDFTSDSAATQEAGTVIRVKLQGTGADAAAIDGKGLYIEDEGAATAGSYLVKLDTLANTAFHISNSGAAADGIKIDVANSYTGQGFVADLGPWLGTSGEGFISLTSDNAATIPAGQFLRFRQLGTGQHAAAIGGTLVYLEDDATAPAAGTSYVMNIDATNIEAIHVDTGKVLVDETVTATGGVSSGTAADSFIYTDTVECNNACIKGLRASPLALVAAPAADYYVELVSANLILDYGSEVLTESADNLVIEYNTSGTDATAAIETTGFIDAAADTVAVIGAATIATAPAANLTALALQLTNTGDGEFGGNASNDTTMTIKVNYRIHKAGL